MALTKVTEQKNAGGIERTTINISTDTALAVTATPTSFGTFSSELAYRKHLRSRITALGVGQVETAALVGVTGRVVADGAGVFTIYLWGAAAASVPVGGYLIITIEEEKLGINI